MNRVLMLLATALVWIACARAAPAPVAPRVQFQGRDWHELGAWAEAHRFTLQWNRSTKTLQLTNRTTRLGFAVDSQQATVDGVKVWLSVPVTVQAGKAYLSALDIETVLQPLLQPVRSPPGHKVRTIMLDPGHGGKDPGNQEGQELEKRYTLLLAQQLRVKLQAAGFQVLLTRNRDVFVGLPERAALANNSKADLFLSLHFNSLGRSDGAVHGLEVFCLTPNHAASTHAPRTATSSQRLPGHGTGAQSVLLAYQVQKAAVRRLGLVDRGVKRARFAVLRDVQMPAVLIEAGFMSSPAELKQITDAAFRARLADAIVEAVKSYKRQVER
ncbi:MAG: N-acetylmuramoyl-L-alanine amidase [Verrucomicrobiales bacterium]|nr:N-acetylmuramoyl-L-alanine amidase [Verrucomicrobiales bacterium]